MQLSSKGLQDHKTTPVKLYAQEFDKYLVKDFVWDVCCISVCCENILLPLVNKDARHSGVRCNSSKDTGKNEGGV